MPVEFEVRLVAWRDASSELRAIRQAVFIVEQSVPAALEWDGLDAKACHILARRRDGKPIGTARLTPAGQIGRMAVLRGFRHAGVGAAMLDAAVARARELGTPRIFLHAQTHATPFYRNHGFEPIGEVFLEAGLLHIEMVFSFRADGSIMKS